MPFIAGRTTFHKGTGGFGTVSDAPVITSAVAGDTILDIYFTAPSYTGGQPITSYEYSINGGSTWAPTNAGTTSPRRISGLTNGTNYTVLLRAVTALGGGNASNAFNDTATLTTQPGTTPSAPTITASTAGNTQLSIAFTAPSSNGGRTITGYEYSINGGSSWAATNAGTTSPRLITGLTNGTNYTVLLRAVNAFGGGTASNSFNDTATLTTQPFTVPSAPTLGSITTSISAPNTVSTPSMTQDCSNAYFSWSSPGASGATITVPFTAPANNGRVITNYEYSTDDGVSWKSAGTTSSPISITTISSSASSLAAGTSYSVKLRAVNAGGSGTGSSTSTPTTPAAVTGYDIRVYDNRGVETLVETVSNHATTSYTRSHNILEKDWSVTVRAKNSGGDGAYSAESSQATGWSPETGDFTSGGLTFFYQGTPGNYESLRDDSVAPPGCSPCPNSGELAITYHYVLIRSGCTRNIALRGDGCGTCYPVGGP